MAVVDIYVDADLVAGKIGSAATVVGSRAIHVVSSFVIAATDAAGSVYRIVKGVSPDMLVRRIEMLNDALTGATSVSCGLYTPQDQSGTGAVVSAACFASAVNVAAGNPITGSPVNMLAALTIANREKRIYEIAGHTQITKLAAYDIALTATAMTTGATGNVCVMVDLIQG